MGASIAGSVYAIVSIIAAYIGRIKTEYDPLLKKAFLVWIVMVIPSLFISNILFTLIIFGFVLIYFSPKEYSDKVSFFILTFTAAPEYIEYQMSAPGISELLYMTPFKVAIFTLLLPVLLNNAQNNKLKVNFNIMDIIMLIFVLYISLMSLRGSNLTSGLRLTVDNIIVYLIPYFAISRTMITYKKVEKFVFCLFTLGLILGAIGIVSSVLQWEFYKLHKEFTVFNIPEYRFGFLRVSGLLENPGGLGLAVAITFISVEFIKKRYRLSFMRLWLLRGALVIGLICAGIRGAMLATMFMFATHIFISSKSSAIRYLMIFGALISVSAYFILDIDFNKSVKGVENIDTFYYRYNLIIASIKQISENMIFGDVNYVRSGNFDHLLQGQGIIDIVNYYLQIALEYGFVGLFMFVLLYALSIISIYNYLRFVKRRNPTRFENRILLCSVLISITLGFLLFIGTISSVSLIGHVGIFILAISRCFPLLSRREPI